jgi:hypothetical protein
MIPIRTRASTIVYRGPTPDVGDAWVERPRRGEVYMTWKPSDEERAAIAAGANLRLGIFTEPIPPVSLGVDDLSEISAIAASIRDRAKGELRLVSAGPDTVPAGWWVVSPDVWEDLNAAEALDRSDGSVPKLLGRPLVQGEADVPGTLRYQVGRR